MATFQEYAQRGMAAIEAKNIEEAIEAFGHAIELAPDRPDMNHALAMAHLHRGDAGSAIPFLQRAVSLAKPYDAPEHIEMRRDFEMSLATAFQLMDRISEAQSTLETVLEQWPDFVEARLQLAQLYLSTAQLQKGIALYREASDDLDKEQRESANALTGAIEAFLESDHDASIFLQGHCESYISYFDEIAGTQQEAGWLAEAAHMAPNAAGEPVPLLPEGARPYAFQRVDLVNPADNKVSGVYSEQDPMVVTLSGLEPLAQVPILLPWEGYSFNIFVSSRCPWHWMPIIIQFEQAAELEELVSWVDDAVGSWYLSGFNGEFGEKERGRFHYITDPEALGTSAVTYVVDLGRAKFEAIAALLSRLDVVHAKHPIAKVIFGHGRLSDA